MYMEAVGGGADLLGMADLIEMEAAGEYTGALVRRTNRVLRVLAGLRRQAADQQASWDGAAARFAVRWKPWRLS